jgi:hypothetical protein
MNAASAVVLILYITVGMFWDFLMELLLLRTTLSSNMRQMKDLGIEIMHHQEHPGTMVPITKLQIVLASLLFNSKMMLQARIYSNVALNFVSEIQSRASRESVPLTTLRSTTGATTLAQNRNGSQSTTQDAVDSVQEDPLQGYWSPMVNEFIALPTISSIVTDLATSLMRPLPNDGPTIDDELLESLCQDHVVYHVSPCPYLIELE